MADTITILEGLAHQQDITTSIIYDVDHAVNEAVSMWQVALPPGCDAVRIIYNNNYDSGASTVFTRARITKLTGI